MKKVRFSSFGFSSILLIFVMICIVTFATLTLVTANSDYKLSKKEQELLRNSYFNEIHNSIMAELFDKQLNILPSEEKHMLVIVNFYNPAENIDFDNDNFEIKIFIDAAISKLFVKDDSYKYLDHCVISEEGTLTHTEMFLFPKRDYQDMIVYLERRRKMYD